MTRGHAGVRVEVQGDISVVVLDSPPLNLFTAELEEALVAAVAAHADARALVFRADGRAFTAGVDVKRFLGLDDEAARELFPLEPLIHAIEALSCPTLALPHGLCVTAGFELCLACDLIVAAESARFGLLEQRFAVTPALGGTQRVAERAGTARAKEMVLTADLFDAATLDRWNIVNRVFTDDTFLDEGLALARRLADQPRQAVRATKRILARYAAGGVAAADASLPELAAPLFASEETSELVTRFLEKPY